MKKIISFVYMLSLLAFLTGCQSDLPEQAAGNKWDLYRTLAYYKYIDRDTAKYAAARFLIDNMPYHFSNTRIYKDNDTLERWRHETDSIYYSIVKDCRMEDFPWDSLWHVKKAHREVIEADTLPDAVIDYSRLCDISELSFEFLTDHIDNAFKVWHESPFARNLTFEEFKEYILPYRCVPEYGFNETGKRYNDLFAKYVMADSTADLSTTIKYYNAAINNLRDMNGKTHRTHMAGVYDLYSRDFHDCIDVASYGCNILRACGLPCAVEYNVSYRSLEGRHYMTAVLNDGKWQVFNPESSLPIYKDDGFRKTVNIYRITYAAQKNTPYFLHAEGEYVPGILYNPCIVDVSDRFHQAATVSLPFNEKTTNRLAYLATYNHNANGMIPVTWGKVKDGKAVFEHAIPKVLYFPVYYPDNIFRSFGEPFYITKDDSIATTTIHLLPNVDSSEERCSLILTRKFPRKPNMIKVAEELVGGRFIGSVKGDFSDAVTLLEIKEAPQPALLTYPLARTGRYKSYRFQSSADNNHSHISMLEWLAPENLGYANTMQALRPHVLSPSDTIALARESHLVRMMDADSWDQMSWKAEYDGNMQTSPSRFPNITLWLKEPQVVTHVRFSPKNADNGICAGDDYELLYWDNGWHSCDIIRAKYEYVEFDDVPKHKLYLLKNRSRGSEEMPFVINEHGEQRFIYDGLVDIYQ